VDELTIQLGTILAVNMFIGQAREVAFPWLIGKLQMMKVRLSLTHYCSKNSSLCLSFPSSSY
jgi:hypothetical protein